jgi:hypothetical protein
MSNPKISDYVYTIIYGEYYRDIWLYEFFSTFSIFTFIVKLDVMIKK